MAAEAVLCVHCGYHRIHEKVLPRATVETSEYTQDQERHAQKSTPLDLDNPFAPSVEQSANAAEFELDDSSAATAKVIADGAPPIYVSLLFTPCFCFPVMALLLPLYALRLLRWWQMRRQFPQLRQPNSLSPYAEIELSFSEAGLRYLVGVTCGLLSVVPLIFVIIFAE